MLPKQYLYSLLFQIGQVIHTVHMRARAHTHPRGWALGKEGEEEKVHCTLIFASLGTAYTTHPLTRGCGGDQVFCHTVKWIVGKNRTQEIGKSPGPGHVLGGRAKYSPTSEWTRVYPILARGLRTWRAEEILSTVQRQEAGWRSNLGLLNNIPYLWPYLLSEAICKGENHRAPPCPSFSRCGPLMKFI